MWQSEWATDLIFNSPRDLDSIMDSLLRHAHMTGTSTRVLRYLDRPLTLADKPVQPYGVVMINALSYNSSDVVKAKRNAKPDAFILDRLVKPLYLAVGLRIIRRRSHMRHSGNADELLEILGDELRPVVGNRFWAGLRETSPWLTEG